MAHYLDKDGLLRFFQGLKNIFMPKTAKIDGFGINSSGSIVRYGTCPTAAATAAKVATLSDTGASFSLETGAVVFIRFTYANGVASPTLNVNGTGAKTIIRYGSTVPGTNANTSWVADSVRCFIYDGTNWRLVSYAATGNDNTVPQGYCTTAAATAAKTATCTNYSLLSNSYLMVLIYAENTAASALTLNVNGKGAKPIYINGSASSASNHTLPAGTYLTYYDGTNYYFRTDGKLTGSITGDAATVNGHTVATDVPSGAKFTDTTYSSKTAASGGTDVSLVTTGEKYTWNSKTSNTGTVTSVATGVGLTGGSITTSGTIKAKLRSETALTRDSAAATETANRVYPVAQDKSGYLAVNVPWTDTNTQTITGVKGNSESSYRTGNVNLTAANIGAAASSHTHAASDISSGTLAAARIPSLDASKITTGTLSRDILPVATVNYNGAMSAGDKAKLDSIDVSLVGAGVYKIRNLTVSPSTSVTLAITEQYGVTSDWDADAIFLDGTQKNLTSPLSITTGTNSITLTTATVPRSDLKLDIRFMKLTSWTSYS